MKNALLVLLILGLAVPALAQVVWDVSWIQPRDSVFVDTFQFWASIPESYNRQRPPALMIWWHHLGQSYHELETLLLDDYANERGWIAATFSGPWGRRHWNAWRGQEHCQKMLDTLYQLYPFALDSIYMIGGSMGGAAGAVWHNNNCGIHDYMAAAAVGGSPILDCQLRWEQQAAVPDTNRSMTLVFGGYPYHSDSVAYEYHRASAVHIADTLESMHYNSLHLPLYNTWGTSALEIMAYGEPSGILAELRAAGGADCTFSICSEIPGHGIAVLNQDSVLNWCAGFSANRFPDAISINADESDEYYWTEVTLADSTAAFGRYGAVKNSSARRIDINLVRNIASLTVLCEFPWANWDTLFGSWQNLDREHVPAAQIRFCGVPPVRVVRRASGSVVPHTYTDGTLIVTITNGGDYRVIFEETPVGERPPTHPATVRLVSAYPNPFNSQLDLEIESPLAGVHELRLYDVTGRVAKTQTIELHPGTQRISLTAESLATGVYFVTLDHAGTQPLKIVLLK